MIWRVLWSSTSVSPLDSSLKAEVRSPIPLTPKGAIWRYAADELESQGPVEKHLLRMGPRNTKLIQAKAREIAQALELPATASR